MPSARVERVAEPRQQLPRATRALRRAAARRARPVRAAGGEHARGGLLERRGQRELLDVEPGDHEPAALAVDVARSRCPPTHDALETGALLSWSPP